MPIAEDVSARVTFKFYATGTIQANTLPDPATEPGSSGGRVLRRTTAEVNLEKDTYRSEERRTDRQVVDFRHGAIRATVNLSGELSPATYFSFLEAAHRDTSVAALTLSDSQFTNVTSDQANSRFEFGGGDPVAQGLRVGDIIRFQNLAATANNNRNFLITGFGGTQNRQVSVRPAPVTDSTPDTSFTVTRPGRATLVPATNHVSRRVAVEVYHEDLDLARLATECRVGGYRIALPATGMATFQTNLLGRNVYVYTGANAPFFTSPTAETTTGICAAVNGTFLVGTTAIGIVTSLEVNYTTSPSSRPVIGQNFVPEIFLGTAEVTGTVTAFFEDATLFDYFRNETEVGLLAQLNVNSENNSPAVTIYLPRVKFGGASIPLEGNEGLVVTLPFQALRYTGTVAGIPTTTIRVVDTEAS